MFITFPYKLVHDKKKSSDENASRPLVSLQMRNACEARAGFRVSGILLKLESPPGANEVGGHDRGNHYLLSTYYRSTMWYLALYTAAVMFHVSYDQNRSYEKRGAFRSHL